MRRLVSVLAAGLLTAGTVLTAASAASAGPAATRRTDCAVEGSGPLSVTAGSVTYYAGTPNNLRSGAAVSLKPKENSTTTWTFLCDVSANLTVVENRGLALTSRSSSPGADVTVEPAGNGGTGFASQQWVTESSALFSITLRNVKTGLWLRVRNGGPVMYQTVTTGHAPSTWIVCCGPGGAFAGRG
jgi:hypothetical protein